MNPTSPTATVLDEVATWAGIHPNPLPADRRAQLLEAGRAKKWFPGWVTKQLASRADAEDGMKMG